MPYNGFNDDIWDEHMWEAHLDEIEKKSDKLRKFISPDANGNLPRWITLLQENADELDAVDAFIEEELQIEDAYFPDEDEEDWEDDEFDEDLDGFFYDDFEENPFFYEEEEDLDAGEEWKELSDDYARSDYGSIQNLEVYNEARELAAFVLRWAERVPPASHSPEYHEYVGKVLRIGAKLAGGYSFGFDVETLGGNIAYTKKALYCANDALVLLHSHLKGRSFMDRRTYFLFHERLFTLRNEIGIYVQDLREEFRANL